MSVYKGAVTSWWTLLILAFGSVRSEGVTVQRCGSEIIAVASELPANHRNSFWIVTFVKTDEKKNNITILSLSCSGTQVYVLNGTDPEGDPVRYGLTFEKGTTEYFRVDSKSGNVTLIQELDREVRRAATPGCSACHRFGSKLNVTLL